MAFEDDPSVQLDLIAASLRADLADIDTFVEGLATKLEQAIPGAVDVQRARNGFRGPKAVVRIAVNAGGDRLELRREHGQLVAIRARVSGGIVLKTEELDLDRWLEVLTETLATQAGRSEQTRQALERLLLS
jgi:hypothetical protein